ncbi:unnamed protein product [Rotaria sp. Silwood2]|nr:unnamed protein product [Rotaria sp. Silwood2]CAF4188001.1 unnamed protein product [Rotaria sp. Silwood2]
MSIRFYILVIVIIFSIRIEGKPPVSGKIASRINYLLNVTKAEKKYEQVLEVSIFSNPFLSPYKSDLVAFINKYFSFQSLRPDIIEIYQDLFTLSDINGLIKFYSSPLGKKLLEKEPQAEIRLTELIQKRIQDNMPQLISLVQQRVIQNMLNNQTMEGFPTIH